MMKTISDKIRRVKRPAAMCLTLYLALLIAALMSPAGCALARTGSSEVSGPDRLCGIWVVFGDDPDETDLLRFSDKDANYIGIEQHDENGEAYIGTVMSGAFTEPDNSLFVKNSDSTYTASATLYVSAADESTARIYSVYIRPDGSRYADPNYDIQFISPDSTDITRTVSTEASAVSSGKSKTQEFIYSVRFILQEPCKSAVVTEMDINNNVIKTADLDLTQPGKSAKPLYSYVTMTETAYVIVEETYGGTQGKSHRTIYSREINSAVKPSEHVILLEGNAGLLLPAPLQIIFG